MPYRYMLIRLQAITFSYIELCILAYNSILYHSTINQSNKNSCLHGITYRQDHQCLVDVQLHCNICVCDIIHLVCKFNLGEVDIHYPVLFIVYVSCIIHEHV